MTDADRTQATTLIALLAALLAMLWALQQGLDPQAVALSAVLLYGAALALAAPTLQAPLGAVLSTSAKYVAFTVVFSVWIAATGAHVGWQLLRGRGFGTGVFA
ncbi:hypothetical protein ACWCQL_13340 [Streptomyces sp. NPDC002073]